MHPFFWLMDLGGAALRGGADSGAHKRPGLIEAILTWKYFTEAIADSGAHKRPGLIEARVQQETGFAPHDIPGHINAPA